MLDVPNVKSLDGSVSKVRTMSPGDRLKAVKENRACFCCLKRAGKDHRAATCSRRRQCMEKFNDEQCKFYHHPLLHPVNQNSTVLPNTFNGVASVESNKEAMLPVVLVDVLGPESTYQRGNLLLDSGAQISLIRLSLARHLRLKGKDAAVTITKVGGEEQEIKTKLYRVRIQSLENNAVHTVTAVGIPCISDDIAEVQVNDIAKRLGIGARKLHRGSGQIDMLIGIDQAKMNTGETKEGDNIVARHSPLGWVVFGSAPGEHASVN